jgi:hypothetical protein
VTLILHDPDTDRKLVVEDDGRTAYAYLLEGEKIVSDVWLYNCDGVASDPAWDDPSDLPFPNRAAYMTADVVRITELSALTAVWDTTGADLRIDGALIARLERGARPGWCRHAAVDGPLARSLAPS